MAQDRVEAFQSTKRPDIALITNHGYAGVEIPFGGAPDTGGQNMYVNALAGALDSLGYRVTIFARGGFPHFESERMRQDPEYLSDNVRYIFVPGGGSEFIHKEDIAVALDEEVEWLDGFIRREAREKGCRPWEVYEVVNSHYWDAAVIGMRLVERWRNDIAAEAIGQMLSEAVPDEELERMRQERHWRALGESLAYHLGNLLIENEGSQATPVIQRARAAASKWVALSGSKDQMDVDRLVGAVASALAKTDRQRLGPLLNLAVASQALGQALLELCDDMADRVAVEFQEADCHVWTPHSLGALKEENFKDKSFEIVRPLKFCERRNHERSVCAGTRLFAATSAEIAERLMTDYRVSNGNIFYFPPCVDRDVFRKYPPEQEQPAYAYLAEISGVGVEELKAGRIVFETSRMDHTKRKDLLLEAFSHVVRERQDVYLFIGGGPEGELFQSLEALKESKPELKKRAFLTGFIPERFIGPLFSIADIYATASEMEGFGMSVIQGAAAASAVVCSDLVPFAVQYASDSAYIVPAGEVYDFARAILELLENSEDRAERVNRLVEITKEFDWKCQTGKFLDYLRGWGISVAPGRSER